VSGVDDQDRPHYVKLLRVLSEVDGWVARIDPAHVGRPHEPAPGSPMRTEDERTHPYELSHAAWHSLIHAVDHLNCLHAVLRDARMIHMFAPYSLVRSALENASAAVWMLHPNVRTTRLVRRLRFAAANIDNSERNFTLAREGRVTDRYAKAIEQFGSGNFDVRLDGIYARERVARDSANDHPTVVEVLAAFVREHSCEQRPAPESDDGLRLSA
jgi:hypothetical protein